MPAKSTWPELVRRGPGPVRSGRAGTGPPGLQAPAAERERAPAPRAAGRRAGTVVEGKLSCCPIAWQHHPNRIRRKDHHHQQQQPSAANQLQTLPSCTHHAAAAGGPPVRRGQGRDRGQRRGAVGLCGARARHGHHGLPHRPRARLLQAGGGRRGCRAARGIGGPGGRMMYMSPPRATRPRRAHLCTASHPIPFDPLPALYLPAAFSLAICPA